MIIRKNDNMTKISSCIANKDIEEDLKREFAGKNIINAVDKYLKLNFYELYNQNNLESIFEKAREDKEIEVKVFSIINKFIHN